MKTVNQDLSTDLATETGVDLSPDVIASFSNATFTNASPRYIDYDADALIGPFAGGTLATTKIGGRNFAQVEEARTNEAWYGNDFDNWGNVASSWDDTAHFGNSMRRLVENTANDQHRSFRGNITADGSSQYAWSNYSRAAQRTKSALSWGGAGLSGATRYNLSTATIIDSSADDEGIYLVKNNVYRQWHVVTSGAAAAADQSLYVLNDNGDYSYTGDGTSGAYYAYAQCEKGAFPSSYIDTPSNASVTRAKDQLYWASADVPSALRRKFTFKWIPYYDNTVGADKYLADFTASGASERFIVYYYWITDAIRVQNLTTPGVMVQSNALTFSARQTMTVTIDPSAGTIEVSGATTGDGLVTDTAWTTTAGDVWWGCGTSGNNSSNSLISEPY